jgi:hypothetical protein
MYEEQRMCDIANALNEPTVFVRFNPDEYTSDGVRQTTSLEERYETLRARLNWHMTRGWSIRMDEYRTDLIIDRMFYDNRVPGMLDFKFV